MRTAAIVLAIVATSSAHAEPLFSERAESRARMRPVGFADIATTPGGGSRARISGAGLGVLIADRTAELGLAFRDARATETDEADQGLVFFAGLYLALDPAERICFHVRAEAGAASQGSLLRAEAGLSIGLGPLAITLGGGVMMTTLNVLDDPVPILALGFAVMP